MSQENDNINPTETEEIKVTDKRRININGEKRPEAEELVENSDIKKSSEVIALENELGKEKERREAAEKKLIEVQARFEQLKSSLEKETAEMRERLKKSLEERAMQGQFNFLITLLPILDNLNLAINAAENGAAIEGLIPGVRGTANGFEKALASVGVTDVPSVGTKFDPQIHEAVDVVEAEEDDVITKEYSRGYKFGERLLRPASVQVGRAAVTSAEAATD
ncbi:MAG: nucleotide exchange factor GrpE [Pyrinomonadaceae bacterium]